MVIFLGQQTSQNSSHAASSARIPRGGPSQSHAQHQPEHRQISANIYSTSATGTSSSSGSAGAASASSTNSLRRGKGRMVGGYYNEEGRPHSKRARVSATVDEDNDDDIEHEERRGSSSRANAFITAMDQHVSYVKMCMSSFHLSTT